MVASERATIISVNSRKHNISCSKNTHSNFVSQRSAKQNFAYFLSHCNELGLYIVSLKVSPLKQEKKKQGEPLLVFRMVSGGG